MKTNKMCLYYTEEIKINDRLSITESSNGIYLAWDNYDSEVFASGTNLEDVRQAIKTYVENAYHIEE
jgi:hypothetical protein